MGLAVSVKQVLRKQAGDTIIEVLIAMAIASSVLAIAFATGNRNLAMSRDSQERSEASRLVQGQIESLRYVFNTAPTTLPSGAGTPFCLSGSAVVTAGFSGGVPTSNLATEPMSGYPATCVSGFYHYVITRDAAGSGSFHFYVRWESGVGGARDQILMVYRAG